MIYSINIQYEQFENASAHYRVVVDHTVHYSIDPNETHRIRAVDHWLFVDWKSVLEFLTKLET